MSFESIQQIFNEKYELKFKLYSLEYEVKQIDNKVVIYATSYANKKSSYNSLQEAFNSFMVYNISLNDSLDRIIIL